MATQNTTDVKKPFKKPRKTADMEISSDSTSSTDEVDNLIEELTREEVKEWLAIHGPKLFSLEASKFNSQEAKRKNLRSVR